MFNDSDNGQTQYCEDCQKWVEKCEKLNIALQQIKFFVKQHRHTPFSNVRENNAFDNILYIIERTEQC